MGFSEKEMKSLILILICVGYLHPQGNTIPRRVDTLETKVDSLYTLSDSLLTKTSHIVNVKEFGAVGDGVTDDTEAIQAAIDYVESLGGGTVIIPEGSIFKITQDGTLYDIGGSMNTAILIDENNVTLDGGGTLYFPNWGLQATNSVQSYIVVGNPAKNIDNVHIKNLRFIGDKSYNDSLWFGAGAPLATIVIGANTSSYSVLNSGVRDCVFDSVGGQAIAFSGGSNDVADSSNNDWNIYAINNSISNSTYSGINAFSGGGRNAIISHNKISYLCGVGIQWSGMSAIISDNTIEHTANSAIQTSGTTNRETYQIVKDNSIYRCGAEIGGTVSASLYVGDATNNNYVVLDGNVIREAYGPGIATAGVVTNLFLYNNLIDGFGIEAEGKTFTNNTSAGINVANATNVVTLNNIVIAGSGANDSCAYGIITGGSSGSNTWTDNNLVSGTFDVASFILSSSVGTAGSGTNNLVGKGNFDLTSKKYYLGANVTNDEAIPIFTAGDNTPSVAGSDIWRTNNPSSDTITTFDNGYVGQLLTVIFNDGNTMVSNDDNIDIYDDKVVPINTLIQFTYDGTNWKTGYEKAIEDSLATGIFRLYSASEDVGSFGVKGSGLSGAGESTTLISNRYKDGLSSMGLFGNNMTLKDTAVSSPTITLMGARPNTSLSGWGILGYSIASPYESQGLLSIGYVGLDSVGHDYLKINTSGDVELSRALDLNLTTIAIGDSVFGRTIIDAADSTIKTWNGTNWITIKDLTP